MVADGFTDLGNDLLAAYMIVGGVLVDIGPATPLGYIDLGQVRARLWCK